MGLSYIAYCPTLLAAHRQRTICWTWISTHLGFTHPETFLVSGYNWKAFSKDVPISRCPILQKQLSCDRPSLERILVGSLKLAIESYQLQFLWSPRHIQAWTGPNFFSILFTCPWFVQIHDYQPALGDCPQKTLKALQGSSDTAPYPDHFWGTCTWRVADYSETKW